MYVCRQCGSLLEGKNEGHWNWCSHYEEKNSWGLWNDKISKGYCQTLPVIVFCICVDLKLVRRIMQEDGNSLIQS